LFATLKFCGGMLEFKKKKQQGDMNDFAIYFYIFGQILS